MSSKRSRIASTALGLAIAGIFAATACNHDRPVSVSPPPPGGTPGTLTVTLTTPNSDDGAIMFELRGPHIGALAAPSGGWRVYADTSDASIRVVVAGNVVAGGLLTFPVPEVAQVGSYTATLLDVANRENATRNLAGYSLTIVR